MKTPGIDDTEDDVLLRRLLTTLRVANGKTYSAGLRLEPEKCAEYAGLIERVLSRDNVYRDAIWNEAIDCSRKECAADAEITSRWTAENVARGDGFGRARSEASTRTAQGLSEKLGTLKRPVPTLEVVTEPGGEPIEMKSGPVVPKESRSYGRSLIADVAEMDLPVPTEAEVDAILLANERELRLVLGDERFASLARAGRAAARRALDQVPVQSEPVPPLEPVPHACWFCGGETHVRRPGIGVFFVTCNDRDDCCALSPNAETEREAIEAHNTPKFPDSTLQAGLNARIAELENDLGIVTLDRDCWQTRALALEAERAATMEHRDVFRREAKAEASRICDLQKRYDDLVSAVDHLRDVVAKTK